MRPTYRIVPGAAGASAGLDIAARLGIGAAIVERARSLIGGDRLRGEAYMDRLRDLTAEAERRESELALARVRLDAERQGLEREGREQAERLGKRGAESVDRVLREFRSLMRREIQAARDKQERRILERELARTDAKLRMERAKALAGLPVDPKPDAVHREVPAKIVAGMRVWVLALAREGEVLDVRGERVDVRLGSTRFTVQRSDLRTAGSQATSETTGVAPRRRPAPVRIPGVPEELRLLGMRVEEALEELDRFLDRSTLAGHAEIRVVHGHGTGRLRSAVREFLRSHAQVQSHRPGKGFEGGDGATVVTLREEPV